MYCVAYAVALLLKNIAELPTTLLLLPLTNVGLPVVTVLNCPVASAVEFSKGKYNSNFVALVIANE